MARVHPGIVAVGSRRQRLTATGRAAADARWRPARGEPSHRLAATVRHAARIGARTGAIRAAVAARKLRLAARPAASLDASERSRWGIAVRPSPAPHTRPPPGLSGKARSPSGGARHQTGSAECWNQCPDPDRSRSGPSTFLANGSGRIDLECPDPTEIRTGSSPSRRHPTTLAQATCFDVHSSSFSFC
jgi:hypothetical protein